MFKPWNEVVSGCVVDGVATLRCIPAVFQNVISAFLMFVGAVALFLIIYSGIKLVTSGGDPKQVEAARKIMTYAIIGSVIVLLSFAIIYFIGYITNSSECITNLNKIATGGC
jgi:predicted secreted protein